MATTIPTNDRIHIYTPYEEVTTAGGSVSLWKDADNPLTYSLSQGVSIKQPEQITDGVKIIQANENPAFTTLEFLNGTFDKAAFDTSGELSFILELKDLGSNPNNMKLLEVGGNSLSGLMAFSLEFGSSNFRIYYYSGSNFWKNLVTIVDLQSAYRTIAISWKNWDGATPNSGYIKAYVDGVQVINDTFSFDMSFVGANQDNLTLFTTLAASTSSASFFAHSNLKGLAMFDRVLTTGEFETTDWEWELFTVPADPTLLTATPGDESITIAWTDNATNETSYTIQRSLDNFSTVEASHVLAADTDSYTDDGTDFAALVEGTTYYYRVFCSNAEGDSGDSNTDSALFSGYKYDITKTVIEWFKDFLTDRAYFEQDGWVFYDLIEENAAILNDKNDSKTGKPFWVKSAHKMETPSLSFVYMPLVVKSKAKNIGGNQEQFATFLFVYLDVSNSKTNLINQYSRVMAQVSNAFDENSLAFPDGSLTNIVRQVPLNDSTALQNTLPAMSALRFSEWKSMPDLEDLNNDRYALRAKFFITAQIQTQPTS